MNLLLSIIFGFGIFALVYFLIQSLNKIVEQLKIIRLQLEIQNPMFVSEELIELDKNIKYWQEKMMKYKNDFSDKNKEIGQVTFDLFWANVERLNHFRIMIAEAKHTGDPSKIHDKYRKWLEENEEKVRNMEKKAKELDTEINEDLDKRSIDYEFQGVWNRD